MAGRFSDKEILLGVTGSIAAYKAAELASRLVEGGATVRVVLTRNAQQFIGAATFEGITGHPVITEMFSPATTPEIEHIALARRAHLFLIAPASANILAKAAQGLADDWLSTTLLATRAPVLFAPAMNMRMYEHPAVQANIATLRARGCHFAGPSSGALACGDVGPGRLIEPATILEQAEILLCANKDLAGKHVLITSGANHEPVDPVRFLGNRSSGRMGRALAMEALRRGARVTVVTGPCSVEPPASANVVRVQTAAEMLEAAEGHFASADIFIAAAAVADYRVEKPAVEKHKRAESLMTLTLVQNPDIARHLGLKKRPGQISVGFAAETHSILAHAAEKLEKKSLDLMVANEVGVPDSGFDKETSRAWLLATGARPEELPLMRKEELAAHIFDRVVALAGSHAAVTASLTP
jgi:phosphopantothenoylcysteine decarboxylase/phosphopantothenate--cysteine ligase